MTALVVGFLPTMTSVLLKEVREVNEFYRTFMWDPQQQLTLPLDARHETAIGIVVAITIAYIVHSSQSQKHRSTNPI